MPYSVEGKLVVAISSRALFDFEEENRVFENDGEQAYIALTPWWQRIVPHSSKMKGWKIGPSHYLNQDLSNVWLAQ